MDSNLVLESAQASLSGSLPFPRIVQNLLSAGVEYYHVDYVSLRFTFYGANGDAIVVPIPLEGLPPVSCDFDAADLRRAIHDSQVNGQKFREYSRRAMQVGVQGYFAFLRGKPVTYLGRQGDQHTEWFPGVQKETGV